MKIQSYKLISMHIAIRVCILKIACIL